MSVVFSSSCALQDILCWFLSKVYLFYEVIFWPLTECEAKTVVLERVEIFTRGQMVLEMYIYDKRVPHLHGEDFNNICHRRVEIC